MTKISKIILITLIIYIFFKKGITPIIRTLDINKIKSLINIEKQQIDEIKIKKLDNLYKKKL